MRPTYFEVVFSRLPMRPISFAQSFGIHTVGRVWCDVLIFDGSGHSICEFECAVHVGVVKYSVVWIRKAVKRNNEPF